MNHRLKEKSLLIADDEPDIVEIVSAVGRKCVTQVYTANNGLEAVEEAKKHPIDIAILDVKMPKMDGIACFRELKKANPDLVVIFLTAFADVQNTRESLRLGAVDFLDKPVSEDHLIASILRSCEIAELRREKKRILEALLYEYTKIGPKEFHQLTDHEQAKALKTVFAVMEMKLMRQEDNAELVNKAQK